MDDLVKRLDTIAAMTAAMIEMGEQIAWRSSEVALMREARDHIEALQAQLPQANAALEAADALAASMAVAISGADAPSTEVDRAREHLAAYRKARGPGDALGDAP